MNLNDGLIGHWKLSGDCLDVSGHQNHGVNHGVQFQGTGPGEVLSHSAIFDGAESWIEVPASNALNLGTGDFSFSAWVHTDEVLDDVLGDVVSQYDSKTRTGFQLGILNHAGVTAAQSNFRHVHFGIDAGSDPEWVDCGRPGNNLFVYALTVYDGNLYAGTFETGKDETGHVYRYAGGQTWVDCGSPDLSNSVASLCVYRGHLYAGTSRYNAGGSALDASVNENSGGNIYRYEGGDTWTFVGHLDGADSITGMAVYKDQLYAIPLYSQGVFRYDGAETWTFCGAPGGRRSMSLGVFDGSLYVAANEGENGGVFRYVGGTEWELVGEQEGVTQVYSFASYDGKVYTGTWPEAKVFRDDGDVNWTDVGRLGDELEVMAMSVYNGKLYAGTLPLAQVYRYEGDGEWTLTGRLDHTPDVKYRRVWSMAIFQGKLFAGTLPSGHVYAYEAGQNVTHDVALASGWRHLVAVRQDNRLALYVDGQAVGQAPETSVDVYDLTQQQPLRIGAGPQDFFSGRMSDVRLYNRGLSPTEVTELYQQK